MKLALLSIYKVVLGQVHREQRLRGRFLWKWFVRDGKQVRVVEKKKISKDIVLYEDQLQPAFTQRLARRTQ